MNEGRIDQAQHAAELLELGDALLELDRDWRIIRVNGNQEKHSRKPRAGTLGRVFWEVWPEAAIPDSNTWRELHRCMEEQVPVQFADYYEPLDLWTGVSAYPTSAGIAVFLRNISAQKKAEEALRVSERRFRALVMATSDVVYRMSADWSEMRELRSEEFIPPTDSPSSGWMQRYIPPDERPRVQAAIDQAIRTRSTFQLEHRVYRADGSLGWTFSRAVPLRNERDDAIEEWFGVATDITDRKLAEDTLREADRRKDEFLGLLGHELRNPLAPIRNAVHILGRVDPTSPQGGRARTIIDRQVNHLARLVDDLLDVKRISTGKFRLHKAVIDLAQQVRETVEDIRPLFVNRAVELDLKLPDGAVWLDCDRTRLAQVLGNLLHNAAKFTNPGGHVLVVIERHAGEVSLRVRDDGAGIAPDALNRLFEPFVQSEKTLHRTTSGLGLGLSLVKGITELHGGTVAVRSEGVGKGTEFVVTLPAGEPAVTSQDAPSAPRRDVKCRVLIIEDNADSAESLRDVIETVGGHEVYVAHDGLRGIEMAREHRPDVVLCDIGLPVIDGYEVARRMRADGFDLRARLVALSGYASAEDIDRALRAGFDYHMAKPPDIDRVLELVADAPGCGTCADVPHDIATGHNEVDAQHASVLAAAARLRTAGPESVWDLLRFFAQGMERHLRYEESLMEDVSYPDLADHRERHRDFMRQMRALQDRLERDGATPENTRIFAETVEAWVVEHVLDQDRRLAEFIRSDEQKRHEPTVGLAGDVEPARLAPARP